MQPWMSILIFWIQQQSKLWLDTVNIRRIGTHDPLVNGVPIQMKPS